MNNRLAEIMRNHGLHKHISADCQHRMELLARLIVQECADLVDDHDDSYPYVSFGDMIKKHFGVEE